ncbi:MAG: hypothetical protein A2Z47_09625 [Thermodesulfovibrio sp. RBG_19FT_COMBO_42_12]|nr:MAG: hypothetical protein A2Z47_09625 [Thermodesulfovibrio sp. RBG_19FT_COMBO_42_12]
MTRHEKIKTFVQETLGCGCPEEVFSCIDCQSNILLNNVMVNIKINIGNRLLIYVVEVDGLDSIRNILTFLVDAGKKERDRLGFNRYRLVLVAEDLQKIKQIAHDIFNIIDKDEKIHLHIISKTDMEKFFY